MTQHSLSDGKQIIAGLTALGRALGYFVETELPVEKDKKNPQAVDVAWLSEKGQEFPLIIFEVESKITNTIANNPLKVFGKSNQSFEKPLFFFHVMVSGGPDTSRINDLRYQYGSHNYRVYTLADDGTTQLIKDILSQHRRLNGEFDLIALIETLRAAWPGVDIDAILLHVEAVGFEQGRGTFLPRYAELARLDPHFQQHFIRYLKARDSAHPAISEQDSYGSYLGYQWSSLVHLGILSLSSSQPEKAVYFQRLKQWQESSSYLTMIGPHFGLSRDYDEFVLGLAPPLWALIALLMYDTPEAVNYIAKQCRDVLAVIEAAPVHISLFTAVWLLHISASCDSARQHFDFAREFINKRGGIPNHFLNEPIGMLNLEEETQWLEDAGYTLVQIPAIEDFRNAMAAIDCSSIDPILERTAVALDALLDEASLRFWSPSLVKYLHCH